MHVSNLQAGGTTLTEGQTVEFEVGPGRKSEEAKNVRPCEPRDAAAAAGSSRRLLVVCRATALERHSPFEPRAR